MTTFDDFNNVQVKNLPQHLQQYIISQNYEHYTPIDHAVWRYVMRQNYSYLKEVAYYPYIKGLNRAGLSIEYIPDLQTMNDHLAKIGWGAVTVDGFIPPVAFMEYQSYRVLVIAADIRQIKHIEYTPAPDIIHESAGHAPIIADADYNKYLSYFGSIGAKAMFSSKDHDLYEAIRALSILKEDPNAHPADIKKAAQKVTFCQDNLGDPSEMALLSRLHWWTVEYGLIGTLENPKIYGAGLLSSIGESSTCMQPEVKKLPYNLDTVNYSYDITQPQPQLFVTPDFQNLITVLEAFADTMSFRKGGAESVLKAIESKNPCTAVYSSGLQVTGVFTDVGLSNTDELLFVKTSGPTALSFQNKELAGHAKTDHPDGFSSPVGQLKTTEKALEDFDEEELFAHQIVVGAQTQLHFKSGLTVTGKVKNILKREAKILLISLEEATVKDEKENILFQSAGDIYDLAVGENITSVFCGAADKDAYQEISRVSTVQTHKITYTEEEKAPHHIYQSIRTIRTQNEGLEELPAIFKDLKSKFRTDWLCALEILEILEQHQFKPELIKEINNYLSMKASNEPALKKLILDGIGLIKNPVTQLIIQE